jgi:hypothetical protein
MENGMRTTDELLREDMRGWRLRESGQYQDTLDLFVGATTRQGRLLKYGDLMFHTTACRIGSQRGGGNVDANWVLGIPTPVMEAAWAMATLVSALPNAVDTPPLDPRLQFCRRCLIEVAR